MVAEMQRVAFFKGELRSVISITGLHQPSVT
jgi:hypothetical protein